MSYEGYVQNLCEKGHLFQTDSYYYYGHDPDTGEDFLCPHCKSKAVFFNDVDDTNCDGVGELHFDKHFLIEPAKVEVCNLGHRHVVSAAQYRVPTSKEVEEKQTRYESDYDENGKLVTKYYYLKSGLRME